MLARIFPQAVLMINGLLYAWVAWLFLSEPVEWFHALGIDWRSAAGFTELRTVYVGLMLALSVFFLLSAWKRQWEVPGLAMLVISYAALVIVRSWGILVEQGFNTLILQIYVGEWSGLLLALLALFMVRRGAIARGR